MASSSTSLDPKTRNPATPSPQQPLLKPSTPIFQNPHNYPLASSGRGFIPKAYRPQSTDHLVTLANSTASGGGFTPRSSALQFPNQVRSFGVGAQNSQQTPSSMRPPSQFGPRFMSGGGGSGTLKTSPALGNAHKSAQYHSPASGNGYRDSRDTNRDDSVVTVNHRKVRLSDGASLYALCRSWVRNGLPKETKPQFGEGLKPLPRPLPVNVAYTHVPQRNCGGDEDGEEKEDGIVVENLSARELLQRHVKRAKNVRARLRKERLQRIERYKQRLAILLGPPDTAAEN